MLVFHSDTSTFYLLLELVFTALLSDLVLSRICTESFSVCANFVILSPWAHPDHPIQALNITSV